MNRLTPILCALLTAAPAAAQGLDAAALRDVAAANRAQGLAVSAQAQAQACAALADAGACKDSACVIAVKAIASHAAVCRGAAADPGLAAARLPEPAPAPLLEPPTVGERVLALFGDGLRAAFGAAPGIVGSVLHYRSSREAARANLALGIAQSDNARAQHEATVAGFVGMGGQIAGLGASGLTAVERSAAAAFAAQGRIAEAALARPSFQITAGADAVIAAGGSATRTTTTTNTVTCPAGGGNGGGSGAGGNGAAGAAGPASGASSGAGGAGGAASVACQAGRP